MALETALAAVKNRVRNDPDFVEKENFRSLSLITAVDMPRSFESRI